MPGVVGKNGLLLKYLILSILDFKILSDMISKSKIPILGDDYLGIWLSMSRQRVTDVKHAS